MDDKKRDFLEVLVSFCWVAPLGFLANPAFAQHQQSGQNTQDPQFPSRGQHPDSDRPELDPQNILKHNQEQIVKDVQKLYELAGQLKEQVEKTDSAKILSLPLVGKAEEIEKLARQIKNRARG